MEFLIFSDAHGRNSGIRAALARQPRQPDGVIFLGDGLRQLDRARCSPQRRCSVCAETAILPCRSGRTPPRNSFCTLKGIPCFSPHGARYGVNSGTGLLETAAAQKGADVVLFGHTHEPYLHSIAAGERVGERTLSRPMTLFNPGSIGYGGSFGHLLLTEETVLLSFGTVFE